MLLNIYLRIRYPCKECGKKFDRFIISGLEGHNEYTYLCDVCGHALLTKRANNILSEIEKTLDKAKQED